MLLMCICAILLLSLFVVSVFFSFLVCQKQKIKIVDYKKKPSPGDLQAFSDLN